MASTQVLLATPSFGLPVKSSGLSPSPMISSPFSVSGNVSSRSRSGACAVMRNRGRRFEEQLLLQISPMASSQVLLTLRPLSTGLMVNSSAPSTSPILGSLSFNFRSRTCAVMKNNRGGGRSNEQFAGAPMASERDFSGTSYVPVYVMLPLDVIDQNCQVPDLTRLVNQLTKLKSIHVDGLMVDCWWGIVEARRPREYNWKGYQTLFELARKLKFKLQVVMSFHACGGNVGDNVNIPLPCWVTDIGRSNPDIFFTDKEGRRNPECLSWGIDKERVLTNRTALEVYLDFMRSFREVFEDYLQDGTITEVGIGLGPCGELRYPSYPAVHGWIYPGIGEFQCCDKYMMRSLKKAAEAVGYSVWGKLPDHTGSYNSRDYETDFFRIGGQYDSYHGRFFLYWYSRFLIQHGDSVLSLAHLVFGGTRIAVKIPGIHWWYKSTTHAAELTGGFYSTNNRDGYAPIVEMLKKYGAAINFTCVEMHTVDQFDNCPEAQSDPEGLVWQVLNAGWDASIPVASENALPCYDRRAYNKILENAKPRGHPDCRHLSLFTYLRLGHTLLEAHNWEEFIIFIKKMHGERTSSF